MQNYIYKIINGNNNHQFKDYFTQNRSIRIHAQNKIGHHDITMGHSAYTQRTFLYRSVALYNKLPRNLTLIKHQHLFKKWIKRYNLNNNIKLKEQVDNNIIISNQVSDQHLIDYCISQYHEL